MRGEGVGEMREIAERGYEVLCTLKWVNCVLMLD